MWGKPARSGTVFTSSEISTNITCPLGVRAGSVMNITCDFFPLSRKILVHLYKQHHMERELEMWHPWPFSSPIDQRLSQFPPLP